ncbi:hypothetical protein EJ08DRAFT_694126 [Tothia fuscella]|uniref:Rhodopsin domain-containing protein n=1 Tax=Tothia fuscella TaxID=1048955 RepID=A0A9P4U1R2_9PEZI|nr:hypothetical protein EJ08DRAFT_694126 [Tothia fuscella]
MNQHDLVLRSLTIDLSNHEQRNWMAAYAVPIQVVTSLLLWLRIATRFSTQGRLGLDDILILIAWALGCAVTGLVLHATYNLGFNRHVWDVPQELWWRGALVGWLVEALFFWSTCFTKVSVLMFYRRLVVGTYSRKFKWAIWIAISFVIAYTIVFFIIICVGCFPVEATWRQFDSQWVIKNQFTCAPRNTAIHLAELVGGLSVITDFYSVMLPAVLLMQIRLNKRQKYGLFFIFGIGFLVVVAGIVRTIYLRKVQEEIYDKIWVVFNIYVTSIAEMNIAIVCACAPSLKALFGRYYDTMSSKYGTPNDSKENSKNSTNNSSNLDRTNGSFRRTNNKLKVPGRGGNDDLEELKPENSFQEAHEYGLETMTPVATGYGDGLVARNSDKMVERLTNERLEKAFGTAHHKRHPSAPSMMGPGSFIISPSPSDTSDDEASLVDKKEIPEGLPYGPPTRHDDRSCGGSMRPSIAPDAHSHPGSVSSPYRDSYAPFSQNPSARPHRSSTHSPSYYEPTHTPHAITTEGPIRSPSSMSRKIARASMNVGFELPLAEPSAGPNLSSPRAESGPSTPFCTVSNSFSPKVSTEYSAEVTTPPPRIRTKVSQERWRQVYEK